MGTGSTSRTSVPYPSTVTASRSAKRIGMQQARDLGEALADRGARLEQIGVGGHASAFLDCTELPRPWVPAQVGEAKIRARGGEVHIRVEREQIGKIDRAPLRRRPGDV